MKLVSHNGRKDTSGRHNDRNFDISKAPHIDAERSPGNKYYTISGDATKTFRQMELEFYKEHFSEAMKAQNARNIICRHPERNKTIRDMHRAKATRPEDKIIQVGDRKSHISGEKLWEIAEEYRKRFNEMYGSHCKILSMALHMDEDTPHVHIRRVWTYTDEDGLERVGERKALEALGVMEKDPSKETGRHNNPKIIFTAQEREMLISICREKGVEIEETPAIKRQHMETPEYKKFAEELQELEREREILRDDIEDLKKEKKDAEKEMDGCAGVMEQLLRSAFMQESYNLELEAIKKKNAAARAAELAKLVRQAASRALEEQTFAAMVKNKPTLRESDQKEKLRKTEHKVKILSRYIADRNLANDFKEYVKEMDSKEREDKNRAGSD